MDISGISFIICMAAAGAEEFCPAVHTFRLAEHMVHTEIAHHLHIFESFKDIADHISFTTDKLVARVNISIGHDRQIFMPRSTSAKTLRQAGASPKIHIEMEEKKGISFLFTLDEKLRQFIIFVLHPRQIRLFDGIIRRVIADNRFHRNRGKSMIEHIFHISSEIQILPGESTADIVFFSIAMLDAVLEIFHNAVISTFIIHTGTHGVMHFLTAVQ